VKLLEDGINVLSGDFVQMYADCAPHVRLGAAHCKFEQNDRQNRAIVDNNSATPLHLPNSNELRFVIHSAASRHRLASAAACVLAFPELQ